MYSIGTGKENVMHTEGELRTRPYTIFYITLLMKIMVREGLTAFRVVECYERLIGFYS